MASWLDYLDAERQKLWSQPQQFAVRQPSLHVGNRTERTYDPWEVSRSNPKTFSSVISTGAAKPAYTPAAPPERFDVSLPMGTQQPAAPQAPTEGDFLGSVGAAFNSAAQGLNIANVIPWIMERTHEFAQQLADSNQDNPIGMAAKPAADATGAFLGAFESMSNVAGPVLDAFPNWVRDSQLNDRAKLYRSIAAGADRPDYGIWGPLSNPLATLGQLGNMATRPTTIVGTSLLQKHAAENQPGSAYESALADWNAGAASGVFGQTVTEQSNQYQLYRDVLLHSIDPDAKQNARDKIAVLLDTIDLPESVKQAIAERPSMGDEELSKLIESAEEGKQWSYQPGLSGLAQNLGTPLLFYLAEAKAGFGVAGGVTALGAEAAGGSAIGQAIATGIGGATKGVSLAAKIQKYAMLSGATTAGLTTALDAVARYQGNQAAVDWWDRVNQPGEFAENMNVQLVSGFTVNPFSAIGALKRGVVRVGKGAGDFVVNRTLGKRLLTFHDSDDLLYGQLAKMYKLGSAEEAKAFANLHYEGREQVANEVVGLAMQHVLEKLPSEVRMNLAATFVKDRAGLQERILTQYGDQIEDALRNHPDELAQRFYDFYWADAGEVGAFNPDVAALKARDYRGAQAHNAELMEQIDAVVGRQDYLAPEAQMLLRRQIEAIPGDSVPLEGIGGLQGFIANFPAMGKYWQGLVDPKSPMVSKAAMETMLQRAELDYNAAAKQNPLRVQTGADPVLRPDSPRRLFDEAQALGTDLPTIKALDDVSLTNPKPEHTTLIRKFLADKTDLSPEEVAALTPQEAAAKAVDYRLTTTEPWVAAGERIVAAEKRITSLREELRRLHAKPTRVRTMDDREAISRAETELAQLHTLTREAGDPIRPFSADVAVEQSAARAADRVRRMKPDKLTRDQAKWLRDYVEADWNVRGRLSEVDKLEGRDLWNAALEIAGRTPHIPNATDARMAVRDPRWSELAARKVAAQSVLDQLARLDEAAEALGLDYERWTRLVRKVEGQYRWSGAKPAMAPGMRRSVSEIFNRQGHAVRSREIMTVGDEEAWEMLDMAMRKDSSFVKQLTRNQRASVVRFQQARDGIGHTNADLHASEAIRSGKATDTEDFIGQVIRLAEARDDLLGPGGPRAVQRTAEISVPPEYVRMAEADMAPESFIFDPEFEAITHPQNIAEVQRILGNPGELYPALNDLVWHDPVLIENAYRIANRTGVPVDDLLTNPAHASRLKELVPPDFEAPTRGVVSAETALDDLVLQGDREAITARTQSLREAAYAQHEPIPTTRARAQAAFRGAERPSTLARRRLVEAGADLTASPNAAIMDDPANQIAMDVISVVNHGVVGTKPATVGYLHTLLREIEDGGASRMGFGASAQADAQRVLKLLIDDAVKGSKRVGFRPGEFAAGLDPAMLGADDLALARALKVEEATSALRRTLEHDVIRAGQEADSQAANIDLGVAKGGTAESGGAVKASAPRPSPERQAVIDKMAAIMQESGGSLSPEQRSTMQILAAESRGLMTDAEKAYENTLTRGTPAELQAAIDNLNRMQRENTVPRAPAQTISTPPRIEPLKTVQRMGEGRRPIGFDQRVNGAAEPGYIYRGIPRAAFDDVASSGVQPHAKFAVDEIGQPASYWSDSITEAGRYNDTLLRIKRTDPAVPRQRIVNAEQAAADPAYAEMKATEHLVGDTVPPQRIEYLGQDYKWHPLVAREAVASKSVPAQTIKNPLEGIGEIRYEPGDPLGTLQYGLKKRPNAAVVHELSRVPGLAEEFVAGRFQPWAERAWTAHARQAYNYLFGAHPNEAIVGAVRENFLERAARQGVDGELADAVWKRWRNEAGLSRDVEIRVNEKGVRQHLPGDNPLYATIANIPNGRMDQWAHQAVDEFLNARQAKAAVDPAYREMAHTIDYANLFRESSSNMKRWLKGESVKVGAVTVPSPVRNETLGQALSKAYGAVAHNKAATTMYYWFRFGLDVRFHAMNFFEAQILYAGRAGLRRGEIDKGLLGQTEGFLRRMDTDFVNNTGYATSRSRFAYAYRTFLKEQPDALRGRIKGLQSENPELMDRALRELADADPQLADMIRNTGGTPDDWVKAMDEWHGKMLKAATEEEGALVIDDAIAEAIRKEPAMAEVYSALGEVNKGLWSDIRGTFYGNASRSRAERFLNSYLLFWPLSYQLKASKWLMRVLFDSAGGLPTNAAGAVMLERAAESHQQLLATDPKYQDWYEKHETLVFVAQMFLPVTPDSMGVSLNPALRSIFFGRTKAIWDIGPIYTLKTLVPRVGEELAADMYPTLRDVPGLGGVYRALTGREPKP